MRLRSVALACGVLFSSVSAQDPKPSPEAGVPTPGPRKEAPKPVFSPPADERPAPPPPAAFSSPEPAVQEPASRPSLDPIDDLFLRLAKWPGRPGREAANALSGLGTRVESRLVESLAHNDWRVQAGAATALGDMGARSSVPALVRAIRDPSNRQSLPELMAALSKVDPMRGPEEILPFLAHASARVRDTALAALPVALDERYIPQIAELVAATTGRVRATSLELFGRVPGAQEREELFLALHDPETEVAFAAARLLGARAGPTGIARLLTIAREGTLRGAAYAMIALVNAEDRRGIVLPTDDDALRIRAVSMLRSDDTFYRGASASLLANLSFRAGDAGLRELADGYLVPILLDAAAGGIFYNDYVAIEDIAFRKVEKLSGESFGKNAPRWRAWWSRAAEGFTARRILRALTVEEIRASTFTVERVLQGGRASVMRLVGDAVSALDSGDALVMGPEECAALLVLLEQRRFFDGGSDAPEPGVDSILVTVSKGALSFDRRRNGVDASDLAPVADGLQAAADKLSWQRFAPSIVGMRKRWIEDRRADLAAVEPAERDEKILQFALAAYRDASIEGRAAAVAFASRAPSAWRAAHGADLASWLASEASYSEQAGVLLGILADAPSAETRDVVFDFFARAPGARAEEAFHAYLVRRGVDGAAAALKSKHGPTRALGARAMSTFKGDSNVAPLLLDGLKDYEPRVRDACVQALAVIADPRTPAMLEAILAGDDVGLRVRAIETLGAVLGDGGVPRLMELFRAGGTHERSAVLRALERAGGARAEIALAGVARESTDVALATEAVDVLARIGGQGAAARLTALFKNAPLKDVRLQTIGALAQTLGPRAASILATALNDQDPGVRRVAMIATGRVGGRAALEPLLKTLENPAGDAAAEDAFRKLTYLTSTARTPRERFLEARLWVDVYGERPRSEWFRAALERAGVDPAPLDAAFRGGPLDPTGFAVLVRTLKSATGPAREAADRLLRTATGIEAAPLAGDADEAALTTRMRVFEAWSERSTAALVAGLPFARDYFEPSGPTAEVAADDEPEVGAESAPASRP